MNAKETRDLAEKIQMETVGPEYDAVMDRIVEKANEGKMEVRVVGPLQDNTKTRLLSEGYTLFSMDFEFDDTVFIRW